MFNWCWEGAINFFFAKDKGLLLLVFMIENCSESVWIGRACMISASFPRDIVKIFALRYFAYLMAVRVVRLKY